MAGPTPGGSAVTRPAAGHADPTTPAPRRAPLIPGPAERRRRRAVRLARTTQHASHVDAVTDRRLRWTFVAFAVLAAVVVGRVAQLQTLDRKALLARGERQLVRSDNLPAQRGALFDRTGRELAMSIDQAAVAANPSAVADPAKAAVALSALLNLDVGDLEARLRRNAKFVYLAREGVTDDVAAKVRALNIEGVFTIDEPRRVLPADDLASAVIGKAGIDNEGRTGLEYQYDGVLRGKPGKLIAERDGQGREIPGGRRLYDPSARGDDLVLTLDRSLQYAAERDLAAQIQATSAKAGTAIVMDTATGELLAIANLRVDPTTHAVQQADKNEALTNVYEPGSVNKLITVAGAIDAGKVAANAHFQVPDHIQIGGKAGHLFTDHDSHPVKDWTVTDIVANSSNVGTIEIAKQLGRESFDSYLRAFGFGAKTGLGDAGESSGILLAPSKYDGTSMGSFPIGQGLAVTAIQMVAAYNSIANGGLYVTPKLVKARVGVDGVPHDTSPSSTRRVVSEQTAADMTVMLREVVRVGTAPAAAVDGYSVAGKTGTARKPNVGKRGYEDGAYVSSFAGFVPAEQPRLTAMVILDQPTPIYGGIVAAPVFAQIAKYALRELRIPPPDGVSLKPSTAALSSTEGAKGVGDRGDAAAGVAPIVAPPITTIGGTSSSTVPGAGDTAGSPPSSSAPGPPTSTPARRGGATTGRTTTSTAPQSSKQTTRTTRPKATTTTTTRRTYG